MSYRQQQGDEERRRAEDEALERDLRTAAYASVQIKRDQLSPRQSAPDLACDGRPLYIGTEAYEAWIKADKRSDKEKA